MIDLCKEIASLGKGIGNENRYRVLEVLMKKPLTVRKIVEKVGLPQPAVSQHLKALKVAHLVGDERRGQEVLYSVNASYMAKLLRDLATNLPKRNYK